VTEGEYPSVGLISSIVVDKNDEASTSVVDGKKAEASCPVEEADGGKPGCNPSSQGERVRPPSLMVTSDTQQDGAGHAQPETQLEA